MERRLVFRLLLLLLSASGQELRNATNALIVVCFADPTISTRRHSVASHIKGCQITIASFRLTNAVDEVVVVRRARVPLFPPKCRDRAPAGDAVRDDG